MAKDFRNASKLPKDFVTFEFGTESPDLKEGFYEEFGDREGSRLSDLVTFAFNVETDMIGTKAAIEEAARRAFEEENRGEDLSGIGFEATDPSYITVTKDGIAFAKLWSTVEINEKYMDCSRGTRMTEQIEEFPLIPSTDGYDDCSWIIYGDPDWEDYENVEKALAANREAEDDFAAAVDTIPEQDGGLKQ